MSIKVFICESCYVQFTPKSHPNSRPNRFCSNPCRWASLRTDLTVRFLAKVEKTDSCWLWTSAINKHGYGTIRANGKKATAHRVAYELFCGPIPVGMCVCHDCPSGDNRACVNPDHLWVGTNDENMADMVAKGRSYLCGANGRAKISEDDVRRIRQLAKDGISDKSIAEQYPINQGGINRIVRRATWRHVSDE